MAFQKKKPVKKAEENIEKEENKQEVEQVVEEANKIKYRALTTFSNKKRIYKENELYELEDEATINRLLDLKLIEGVLIKENNENIGEK